MRRMKSPLVALIAALVLIGPISGRISQIDPNDPLQISTPTAYERSQGLAEDEPTVELEFVHGVQEEEDQRPSIQQLPDQILLFGEDRLSGLDRETLTLRWDIQLPMWSDTAQRSSVLYGLSGEESRHVIVGNNYTHSMIDIDAGEIVWTQEKTYSDPSSNISIIGDGLLLHEQESSYGDRLFEVLKAANGEFLTQIFKSGYPDTRAYEGYFVAEAQDHIFGASSETVEVLWIYYLRDISSMVYFGEKTILVIDNEEVIGIDPATGQELWLLFVPSDDYSLADTNESVALLQYDHQIISIDLQTGLQLQTFPRSSEDASWPTLYGNRLINLDERGVALIDVVTGEELWRLDGATDWFDLIWEYDNPLVQTSNGQIATLDSTTLDLTWSGLGFIHEFTETSILRVDSEIDEIALLDASTGDKVWAYTFTQADTEVYSGYGYVVLTSASTIIWLDALSGEIVQQVDRAPEWAEIQPAGELFFVTNDEIITLHDPLSGQTWELQRTTYQGGLDWRYVGDYFFITYREPNEKQRLWQFNLSTRENIWTSVESDDWATFYREDDGIVFTYEDGVVQRLNPDGTQGWQAPIAGNVTSLTRRAEHGKLVVHLDWGIQVLEEATGETVLTTDTYNDPGMNTTPTDYAWVQVAPGRIFEPGMSVSRVYRTADALPEILAEDTVLHAAPNANAVDRGTFAAGTEVTRTGNERAGTDRLWLEVTIDGTTGWVPKDVLTEGQPVENATPVG